MHKDTVVRSRKKDEVVNPLAPRGLKIAPKLAVGDGAPGFWAALRDLFPATRDQRCWVQKFWIPTIYDVSQFVEQTG